MTMQRARPRVAASNTVRVRPGQSAVIVSPPTTSGWHWKLMTQIGGAPVRSMRSTCTVSSGGVPAGRTMSGLPRPGLVRTLPSFMR